GQDPRRRRWYDVSARDDVLARVRTAIGQQPELVVSRAYRQGGVTAAGDPVLVDLFEDRLVDYRATVRRTAAGGIADTIAAVFAQRSPAGARIVVPAGLERGWVSGAAEVVVDDGGLTAAGLDKLDAVVTACVVAIAETGTIVLDGSADQGRRAISLVPDLHVCVVRVDQIVDNVPDALRLLEPTRPLTFISGGSATSDIELKRVEGVHGPTTLEVVLVTPS
ncbi:MAG TPA: LUD domain-containing protein, partial [Mycobacteriales bacterium]|nr:LUD domain-containing protein [Mycobacteriales bacterium]